MNAACPDDNDQAAVPSPATFVAFSVAQGISAVGTWMQKTGVGWMAWELTQSPFWVGAIVMTDVLSALWVAPLAGAVTDRTNPYRLIWITQSLAIVQATILGVLVWVDALNIWGLLALALADSTIQGFNQPVRMTIIGHLAGRARMSQAIASNSVAFNLARMIGPALGGLAIHEGGAAFNFLANAVSYFAMLAAIVWLRRWTDKPAPSRGRHVGSEVVAGFSYILGTPDIYRLFILLGVVSVLARPFADMFPALVGAVFGGGPATLSLLMSSQGAGAMAGALLMLRQRQAEQLPSIILGCAVGLCLALIVFSSSILLLVAVPAMVVGGACHVVFNIGMQSTVQMRAPSSMKGRVASAYWLLFRCCPALGAFIIGLAANLVSLQTLIGGGAVAAVLFTLAFAVRRLGRSAATEQSGSHGHPSSRWSIYRHWITPGAVSSRAIRL